MLGVGSLVDAGVDAWVTVGCLSGGGVGPLPPAAVAAGWIGVGVLATSGSDLGTVGTGRPLAGSLGVTGPGRSFSGCVGTEPGATRL
jgi:hypothetical protein